jgi:hypothetical protein
MAVSAGRRGFVNDMGGRPLRLLRLRLVPVRQDCGINPRAERVRCIGYVRKTTGGYRANRGASGQRSSFVVGSCFGSGVVLSLGSVGSAAIVSGPLSSGRRPAGSGGEPLKLLRNFVQQAQHAARA